MCWQAIGSGGIDAFAHECDRMATKRTTNREYAEYGRLFPGYDDEDLKRMAVSKEFYLKYKDK